MTEVLAKGFAKGSAWKIVLVIGLVFGGTEVRGQEADGPEAVNLATGETRRVEFPEGAAVHVSRRGVVELFHVGGTAWQLTGLRGGLALVEGTDPATGAALQPRLLVTVRGANEQVLLHDEDLPAWVCAETGIKCRRQTGEIAGTSNSWDWHVRAAELCASRAACLFRVRLSEAAAADGRARMAAILGPLYAVRVSGATQLVVDGTCDDDGKPKRLGETLAKLGAAAHAGLVAIGCHGDAGEAGYRLSAYLFLLEKGAADRLGFSGDLEGKIAAAPPRAQFHAAATLQALMSDKEVRVVGRPVARLTPDRAVELASGGEFKVTEPDTDGRGLRASWKQHGLLLKATAEPLADGRARLRLSGSLKSRQHGDVAALSLSSLDSAFDVTLGKPMLAAVLDLESDENRHDRVAGLGALPIIGPLFRAESHDQTGSRLLVWLMLERDDGQANLPLFTPSDIEPKS